MGTRACAWAIGSRWSWRDGDTEAQMGSSSTFSREEYPSSQEFRVEQVSARVRRTLVPGRIGYTQTMHSGGDTAQSVALDLSTLASSSVSGARASGAMASGSLSGPSSSPSLAPVDSESAASAISKVSRLEINCVDWF